MKVRFLANKKNYHDSIAGVGLLWNHGEIKEVTPQVAEKLAVFPSVFELIRGDTLKKGATGKKAKQEKPVDPKDLIDITKPRVDRVLPVVNFHAMNKASLIDYMRRYYNEDLNQNKPEADVRKDAVEIFTRKENQRIDEEEEKERLEEQKANSNWEAATTN